MPDFPNSTFVSNSLNWDYLNGDAPYPHRSGAGCLGPVLALMMLAGIGGMALVLSLGAGLRDPRFLAMAAFTMLPVVWLLYRRWVGRLDRNGQLVRGIVQQASHEARDAEMIAVTLTFAFKSPKTGKELTRQRTVLVDDDVPVPRRGAPVAVQYFNDRLYRLL